MANSPRPEPAAASPPVHVDARAAVSLKRRVIDLGPTGTYELIGRLGTGGMADVVRARRLGPNGFARDVALKCIRPNLRNDRSALRRFIHEARVASHLHHPAIAQVYDLHQRGSTNIVLVMEWIDGTTLRERLRLARIKAAPFSPGFACHVGAELADALAHAHTATDSTGAPLGIVHRDVTPANVMLTRDARVKLLDFGISFSRLAGRDATQARHVIGKCAYMSPEQILRHVPIDGRSDLFALGLILVELLTLRRVFAAETDSRTMVRIAEADPRLVAQATADLPPTLASLLRRLLSRDRERRPRTGDELARDLRSYLASNGIYYSARDALDEFLALTRLPEPPLTTPRPGPALDATDKLHPTPRPAPSLLAPQMPPEPTLELELPPPAPKAPRPRHTYPRLTLSAAILLAIALALAQLAPSLLRSFNPSPRPILHIESTPSGALVLIGNIEVGRTPYLADNDYPEGLWGLHLRLPGYRPYDVTFAGDRPVILHAALQRR